jgi:hypothetical protein
MKPLECVRQFLDPLATLYVSSVMQSLLESIEYHSIGALDLFVGPWMGD